MERDSFDRLVRLFDTAGSRRTTLRLLATGALLGAGTLDGTAAKRRRSRQRGRVRTEAVAQCEPTICRPGIDCVGKTLGPGKNLARCDFGRVNFSNVNLSGANISGAVFLGASFFGVPRFSGANASNACFAGATLNFANFQSTNLRGASLFEADIRGADFRGSNITAGQLDCAMVNCATILPNGKPAVVCDAGQTCCDVCTDTNTDPLNCGACGTVCEPPATCEQGSCGVG